MTVLEQVKTLTASRVFTDLLSNSPKRSTPFSPGHEGTENMFYFLSSIIVDSSMIIVMETPIYKLLKIFLVYF